MKIVGITLAAVMTLTSIGMASPAVARDHHGGWHKRYKVCHMVRRHHHRERVCTWHRR